MSSSILFRISVFFTSALLVVSFLPQGTFALEANGVINVPLGSDPTIDGMFTSPTEWTGAAKVTVVDNDSWILIIHAKRSGVLLYLLLDFITDLTNSTGDRGRVMFDSELNAGDEPQVDDFLFHIDHSGTASFWGTGVIGWTPVVNPVGLQGAWGFDPVNDQDEEVRPHMIYELAVPLNYLHFTDRYGFAVEAYDSTTGKLLTWPQPSSMYYPSTWGDVFLDSGSTVDASGYRVLSAQQNDVYYLYPDFQGVKPNLGASSRGYTLGYALLSDWTASGIVMGLSTSMQNEHLDTGPWLDSDGRPLLSWVPAGRSLVAFGGPAVNSMVYYYEHASGGDAAPVYSEISGDTIRFRRSSDDASLAEMDVPTLQGGNEDIFVIQALVDGDGRYVLVLYGMGWRGTWASAKYFKFILYPSIGTFTSQFYIVWWRDATFGSSDNQLPDMGDTFNILAQG